MPEPIKIAGLQIEAGQKQRGWLPVCDVGAVSLSMPFTVINGIEDGPRLAVMAGIHGSEYTGIEATIRLARDLDPSKIRGSLYIVHIVNIPAFQTRTQYVNPLDGKNLNKIRDNIPSEKPAGSISHRILYTLFSEVVFGSDACIDLHAGDLYEALSEPFIIYPITPDDKTNQTIVSMAQEYGVGYMWGIEESGIVPGGVSSGNRPIPSIMVECGQEGKIEEPFVQIHYNGVLNVMRLLGMLDAPPSDTATQKPVPIKRGGKIECDVGGLFYSYVKPADRVSKGDLLGEVKNIWGEVQQEITAPADCMILMYVSNPVIAAGDVVFGYAEF
jgi:predicted deacylase